jgi:type IV pilus assembly protein PilV
MSSKKHNQGVTLVEVLVAVLVLSLGLLGALKLQTEGVRLNADSKYTVMAAAYAQDALDALSFNRAENKAANRSAWTSIKTGSTTSSGDAGEWLARLKRDLPAGKADVSCAANACTVVVSWTPPGRDPVSATYSMYDN